MRQLTMALTAILVGVAVAVLGVFLWLRAYTPLSEQRGATYRPGAGLSADIEPTFGSGGKTVYVPAYKPGRPFDTTFTLVNTGRFGVTVKGLVGDARGPLTAEAVLDPGKSHPIRRLHIDPHETALVVVRWRLDCTNTRPNAEFTSDRVVLRYSYLSLFSRTQPVELPFAVTLRCHDVPRTSP